MSCRSCSVNRMSPSSHCKTNLPVGTNSATLNLKLYPWGTRGGNLSLCAMSNSVMLHFFCVYFINFQVHVVKPDCRMCCRVFSCYAPTDWCSCSLRLQVSCKWVWKCWDPFTLPEIPVLGLFKGILCSKLKFHSFAAHNDGDEGSGVIFQFMSFLSARYLHIAPVASSKCPEDRLSQNCPL